MNLAAATIAPNPPPGIALIHAATSPVVELVRACSRIAATDATVLITGETGVGKEVFARLVHERSARAAKPIVAVNCGAIPEALLESELFGHVKGAFTGAMSSRKGRIASAEGGTLFLDEIGELPLSLQVKLLRVLQERCYEPVGASESVPANFRLVVATNRDLAAEVEVGRFRRDLYYRLLVCPVEVPPLRARPGDVAALFMHFWSARGEARPVAPAALEALRRYGWPGNVRELENLVERLSVCCEGAVIGESDLPPHVRGTAAVTRAPNAAAAELSVDEVRPMLRSAPPAGEPITIDQAHPVDLPDMLRRIEEAYADFLTLLFAFFVVMYSVSRVDQKRVVEAEKSMRWAMHFEGEGGVSRMALFDGPPSDGGSVMNMSGGALVVDQQQLVEHLRRRIEGRVRPFLMERSSGRAVVTVVVDGKRVTVRLAAAEFFDPGQAALRPQALPVLDAIAAELVPLERPLEVEGHTDDTPVAGDRFRDNWELSACRAATVTSYLEQAHGVEPRRLRATGFADTRPVAPATGPAGRELNRRIELVLELDFAARAPQAR